MFLSGGHLKERKECVKLLLERDVSRGRVATVWFLVISDIPDALPLRTGFFTLPKTVFSVLFVFLLSSLLSC